jgi:hypothetical protein
MKPKFHYWAHNTKPLNLIATIRGCLYKSYLKPNRVLRNKPGRWTKSKIIAVFMLHIFFRNNYA